MEAKQKRTTAKREWADLKRQLGVYCVILGIALGVMWTLEFVDQLVLEPTGFGLDRFGVRPRSAEGLWGILVAPWLHGDFAHLISNTVPFVVLSWLVLNRSVKQYFAASLIMILLGGALTWLVGQSNSVHIGASGWVFGLFSYLLFAAWYDRKLGSLLVTILVVVLYGSTIAFGVLPTQEGISWEMHLFGFLGGLAAAKLLIRRKRATRQPKS